MRVFVCFFAFFGAKIWPAAADTGELARDLRDQTPTAWYGLCTNYLHIKWGDGGAIPATILEPTLDQSGRGGCGDENWAVGRQEEEGTLGGQIRGRCCKL